MQLYDLVPVNNSKMISFSMQELSSFRLIKKYLTSHNKI